MPIHDNNMDELGGFSPRHMRWKVSAKTSSYTITDDDWGTLFTIGGTLTMTLPSPTAQNAGRMVRMIVITNNILTISCSSTDSLIVTGDAAADTVATDGGLAAQLGAAFECVSTGSLWAVFPMQWDTDGAATASAANVSTVTT